MQYSRYINPVSSARMVSPLRKITELVALGGPDLISLGTGAPNVGCFPFEKITVQTKKHGTFTLEGGLLNEALQYGPSSGMPQLRDWLKKLQIQLHNPPILRKPTEESLDILITPGSNDALCKIFEMSLSPGDNVLIEEPTYPATLSMLRPLGVNLLGVTTDEYGLSAASLRAVLGSRWSGADAKAPQSDVPKLLYLQPTASNPCGVGMPLERRLEILKVANEYDLLIIEDDPYYFLSFLEEKPPSFLSLDTHGRVLRLDSFSKVMSSGIRLGFVSGPKPLIDRIMLHVQVSSMQCSSLSQGIVFGLLNKMGYDGFLEHTKSVAEFYHVRCQEILTAAEKHLTGLAQWRAPVGGMFLWLQLVDTELDAGRLVREGALQEKVVLVPGDVCFVDAAVPRPFLRASYSNVSQHDMDLTVLLLLLGFAFLTAFVGMGTTTEEDLSVRLSATPNQR